MELAKAVVELNSQLGEDKLSFDSSIQEKEMEELFLNAIETLSETEENKVSDGLFDFYESICNKHESQIKTKIKMENQMSEEKGFTTSTEQEKINFLLETFKYWEDNDFMKIDLPDEVTLKLLEKAFLESITQMSWETKQKGGYTREIDQYLVFIKTKPRKSSGSNREQLRLEEEAKKAKLDLVGTIVSTIVEQTIEPGDSVAEKETAILSLVLNSSVEQFMKYCAEKEFSTSFLSMIQERKIDKIKVKRSRVRRGPKKWDGEGEPFSETSPNGDPSMTFEIWKRLKKGKSSINNLNKIINEKFPKSDGKERDVSKLIKKMKTKVSDFLTITIPKDPDGKITVEKVD